jgi:hypothetical protein
VKDAEDALAAGGSYEEVAKSYAAVLIRLPFLSAAVQDEHGKTYTDLPRSKLEQWLGLRKGAESEMQEHEAVFYIAKVVEVKPAVRLSLDDDRARIAAELKAEAIKEYVDGVNAKKHILGEKPPLPHGENVKWERREVGEGDPLYRLAHSFLEKGHFAGVSQTDDGVLLLRIAGLVKPTQESGVTVVYDRAAEERLMRAFLDHLYERYKVRINERAISELVKQYAERSQR